MDVTKFTGLLPPVIVVIVAFFSAWRQFRSSIPPKEISVDILGEDSLPYMEALLEPAKTPSPLPERLRLISVRIRNSGRKDILSSDYLETIRLAFNEPVLSSALYIQGDPNASSPLEPEADQYTVALPAIQLRPKGFVTVNTLTPDGDNRLTVNGVLADGQIMMIYRPSIQPIGGSSRWVEGPPEM